MDLKILGGGAAKALVLSLTPACRETVGAGVTGEFAAVGGMRDRLIAGEPADVMILTRALVDALAEGGHVDPATVADLGDIPTGVAVPERCPPVDVSSPEALKAALTAADAIYISDPAQATAGKHFMRVLAELGIAGEVDGRLRSFASGHIGMAAMTAGDDRRPIGCTQLTEIVATPGTRYCGDLPEPYRLVTTYSAAVTTRAADPEAARAFVALLSGAEGAAARKAAGFGG